MPGFRDEYCTTVYQHRLFLHGGNDATDIIYTPDLWELDLTTYVWTLLDGNTTASNFSGRALCQASVQNVMNPVTGKNELKLIIAGGQNNGFQTSSWQWVFYIHFASINFLQDIENKYWKNVLASVRGPSVTAIGLSSASTVVSGHRSINFGSRALAAGVNLYTGDYQIINITSGPVPFARY